MKGVEQIPLRYFADDRGWFLEVRRESAAARADGADERLLLPPRRHPRPALPRAWPGRPLRLPDAAWPASSCSTARAARLHRSTSARRTPSRSTSTGAIAHGFEALTDLHLLLPRHARVRPGRPGRARDSVGRPAREAPLEHAIADPVGAGSRILLTGGGRPARRRPPRGLPGRGRPGAHAELDVTAPLRLDYRPELVLHAAAWTDVDGAEADEEGALRANVEGTRNVVALGAPVVYFSSDYVFDGTKREPYVEVGRTAPALRVRALEAPRGARGATRAGSCGTSWLFGCVGAQLRSDDAAAGAGTGRGAGRGRPARLPDLRGASRRGGSRAPAPSRRCLARRRGGRVHLGGVRRGGLRRGGPERAASSRCST